MSARSPRYFLICVAGGLLLTAGCAEEARMGEGPLPIVVTKLSELPPPNAADLVAVATPYRIGPFDKLTITVFGAPDLSGTMQTDASGRLSMPLIGDIDAAGQSPSDLADTIAGRLRGVFVKHPHVSINLEETTSQVVTVDGQVGQPGSYPVVGNMSLMRAIAAAKGATEFARLNDVVVFRTVNGRSMAALYNLDAIQRGRYADPKIYANDVVMVGDSVARRRFQQFIQVAPLLTTPLILALERIP